MNSYFAPLRNDSSNNQKIMCTGSLTIITLRKESTIWIPITRMMTYREAKLPAHGHKF